jgi:hypothetical protein
MTDRNTDLGRKFVLAGDEPEGVEECTATAFADGDVLLRQAGALVYLSRSQVLQLIQNSAQPQAAVTEALLDALQGLLVAYGATDGRNGNSGECWDRARKAVVFASSVSRPDRGGQ